MRLPLHSTLGPTLRLIRPRGRGRALLRPLPCIAALALLAASLAGAGRAAAQAAPDTTLTGEALLADVAVLKDALETLHPGLLRYSDAGQVADRFHDLQARVEHGRTLSQAYVDLAEFLATIRCGHTYPNFFNQSPGVAAALLQHDRVPFLFRWMDGRMVVTRDFTGGRLPRGTEIRQVNGVDTRELLRRLMALSRADGSNDAKRVANLNVLGDSRYEAFDVYFPLLFPPPAVEWTLSVSRPGSAAAETLAVRPMPYAERVAAAGRAGVAVPEDGPVWELRFLDGGTAYLRMPTWALFNSRWQWKAWLADAFTQIARRGARDLVVDLRGNEGGSSVGDEVLRYLTPRDLPLEQFSRRVRYRRIPARLRPYLDTWDRSFDDWGADAKDFRDGYYTLTRYDDAPGGNMVHPAAPGFRGHTWVLVDASNSSATFEFAQAARAAGLATLVGQPTGGNQRGINGGAFYFLRLPHSGIEVDLPLIGLFSPGDRPDAGLTPDVPVRPTPADIARGVDTELQATLALIRRARPGPRKR